MEVAYLPNEYRDTFLNNGYLAVRGAFKKDFCDEWIADVPNRIREGISKQPNGTFRLNANKHESIIKYAPKLYSVISQVIGSSRSYVNPKIYNSFVINPVNSFPWTPPTSTHLGWHIDGSDFRHYLDLPRIALVILVYFTNVEYSGGGTFVSRDSIPIIANLLLNEREGILPWEFPYKSIFEQCINYTELIGRPGDAFILHPFALHCASMNSSNNLRILYNGYAEMSSPLNFSDVEKDQTSLLKESILQALQVSSINYNIERRLEKIDPKW